MIAETIGWAPDERPPLDPSEFSMNGHDPAPAEAASLSVQSAREIAALPLPARAPELCGPALVRGCRTVLGAATGHGKTTMTMAMIGATVGGGDFLDWTGAGDCRALVIDVEQNLRTIQRRVAEAGLGESDAVDFLRVPDGLALDQDAAQIDAVEAILAAGDYALVVADPLYKLHRGDANDDRAATDLMRRFDGWRDRFDFALLSIMHPRKKPPQGAKFTMDDFFGSGAYLRGAEIVLGLERLRPGYSRLHFFKDRDGDLPVGEHWGLLFDIEHGFRRDSKEAEEDPTTVERIRDLLEQQPGMTLEALQGASDRSERGVRDALGVLDAVGSGRPKQWSLPTQEAMPV